MGFFGPTKIPDATRAELEARASTKVSEWNASKKTWAHIMSLAKNCQNTVDQFGVGFGPNSTTGYINNYQRPEPQIDRIEVRKLGDLGTTKKTTITLRAFTQNQLNNIAKCYLIPGMSIRVQYGWSLSATGKKSVKPHTAVSSDVDFFNKVRETQKQYSDYDGMQGRLVNYSINSSDDGVWTITLELTGIGSMLKNTKANNYSSNCSCTESTQPKKDGEESTGDGENTSKLSNLSANLLTIVDNKTPLKEVKQHLIKTIGGEASEIYEYYVNEVERNERGEEGGGGFFDSAIGFVSFNTLGGNSIQPRAERYVSLRLLQKLLVEFSIKNKPSEKPIFQLNSDKIRIKVPEYQSYNIFCADPRVAIIPGSPASKYLPTADVFVAPTAYPNNVEIELNKIIFNVKYLRGVLEGLEKNDDSIFTFLQQVLSAFNFNCGNLWDFAFVDTTTNDNAEIGEVTKLAGATIAIIDTKTMNKSDNTYTFPAKAAKSNVRSLKMDLKLTEAMKTQALYSGNIAKPSTRLGCGDTMKAFTRLSGINLADPASTQAQAQYEDVINKIVDYVQGESKKSDNAGKQKVTININDKLVEYNVPLSDYTAIADAINIKLKGGGNCGPGTSACKTDTANETPTKRLEKLQKAVTSQTVEAVRGDIVNEVSIATEGANSSYCLNSIIPAEFGVTIDGIGGLQFGQSVDCDRFPDEYRKYFYYQVTAIEHTISVEDWVTTVTTIARLKE